MALDRSLSERRFEGSQGLHSGYLRPLQSLDPETITGTVTDTEGTALVDAQVSGLFEDEPIETTTTDESGANELTLPPATYTMEVTKAGFQGATASVLLEENDTVEQDFELPEGPPRLPGYDNPPQDLTEDGLFEDIDGDGEFDIFEVQALFNGLDSDAVQNHPTAFNFSQADDPEQVTTFDVQALFNRLVEWD